MILVLTCLTGWLFALTGYTLDENKDGKPDVWLLKDRGVVREFRADRNFDGKIDQISQFDGGSRLTHEEYDYNFDGEMDDFYFFEGGMLVKHEIDSNFDKVIDMRVYLHEGMYIKRIERDEDFDGEMDRISNFDRK